MFTCPTNREHDEFVAYPAIPDAELELGIVVNAKGEMTNRWEDGIAGVPVEYREFVEAETDVACAYCGANVSWEEA